MGKRKRPADDDGEEEEGETDEASSSSLAQQRQSTTSRHGATAYFKEPSAKRIKRERDSLGASYNNDEASSLPNGAPSSLTQPFTTTFGLNGSTTPMPPAGEEDFAVWLIRKPTDMPMDELHKIQFSRKKKYHIQRIPSLSPSTQQQRQQQRENEAQQRQLECRLGKPGRHMIRIAPEGTKQTIDEKQVMKPESYLRGIVWISESEVDPSQTTEELPPAEEFMGPNEEINSEEPQIIGISSIRRKPEIDDGKMKERLKAFGTTAQIEKESNKARHKRKK